eukprot:scaffold65448_cov64-Phaeocystis_antarctica.AAC.1
MSLGAAAMIASIIDAPVELELAVESTGAAAVDGADSAGTTFDRRLQAVVSDSAMSVAGRLPVQLAVPTRAVVGGVGDAITGLLRAAHCVVASRGLLASSGARHILFSRSARCFTYVCYHASFHIYHHARSTHLPCAKVDGRSGQLTWARTDLVARSLHGLAQILQQGQVHARLAAGRAAEGIPAPGARGQPWSRRFRREVGHGSVEEDGQDEEEEGAASEDICPRPVRCERLRLEIHRRGLTRRRLWRLQRLCLRAPYSRRLRCLLRRPQSWRLRRLRLRLRRLWRCGGGGSGGRWRRRVGNGSGSGSGSGASGRRRVGGVEGDWGQLVEQGLARLIRRQPRRCLPRARARRLMEGGLVAPPQARQGRPAGQRPQKGRPGREGRPGQ